MREKLIDYARNPTPENFSDLREALFAQQEFDPYSSELDKVPELMNAGEFQAVVDLVRDNIFPNHFLSPGAHLNVAFACDKLGRSQEAEMEQAIAVLLLQGIAQTGDGSEEKPFKVTRVSDEYDFLFAHQLSMKSQALLERDSRSFDRLTLENGDELWFEITEIQDVLRSKLASASEDQDD